MIFSQKKIFFLLSLILLILLAGAFSFWFFWKKEKVSFPQILNQPSLVEKGLEPSKEKKEDLIISEEKEKCLKEKNFEQCFEGRLIVRARDLKNSSLCDLISSKIKDTCFMEVALTKGEEKDCLSIQEEARKNSCLSLILHSKAIASKDLESCPKIPQESYQDSCFRTIFSFFDLNFCDKLKERQEECREVILMEEAMRKRDSKICEKLSPSQKEVCLAEMPKGPLDSDQDGLSDEEEKKWKTDPQNPDSDADGYKDGEEVSHGYNPLGTGKL